MSFDTKKSNTGVKIGACVELEKLIGRELATFPCRHHIYELNLRAVFDVKMSVSRGPDVLIFERFSSVWPQLDHKLYKCGLDDETVSSKISNDVRINVKGFCFLKLTKAHIRAGYKEMLQLALVFLGENVAQIRTPGPTSHVRWMCKAIYSLKIFLEIS